MENMTLEQVVSFPTQASEKPSILYIDDEEDNLVVFKSAFRRHYNVHTAKSGEEGLEILKSLDASLVITDQRMPRMTGVQFLKNLPEDKDTIRMILTGYSDMESVVEAINTGQVYRYIVKPWDKEELKITLDNAIEAFQLRRTNKHLIHELQEANEVLEQKVEERTQQVNQQKEEIEKLLLNILPVEVANELKETGAATPRFYESATVLFTDFVGFTSIAEGLSPNELVSELNNCFLAFDTIVEKNNLEKIKTIGDAYMCAGGLPVSNQTHAVDAILAAIEIQEHMKRVNEARASHGLVPWSLRIGIHTGPLVAGVVGRKKFAYDIWGDTVNLASRIESSGEGGKINISETTFEAVKEWFSCLYRGKVPAKNKGEVDMYFVQSKLNKRE
ncbi:adenylate/guanylate cyclase domain-containing protein [Rufibacter roseolus]|uniref:adenylate/guanylate cyclase domain-containing protein n=1 Tax=Rufibacter roseolus TaxID=2817375 RepID=UPI001B3128F3|nr:adenylate/guanylate cyclase domain-containing protein [Rufibacter roseolus]